MRVLRLLIINLTIVFKIYGIRFKTFRARAW